VSTESEIAEVFNAEINERNKLLFNKSGIAPFIKDLNYGYSIEHLHKLDEEDLILLDRICQQEGIDD